MTELINLDPVAQTPKLAAESFREQAMSESEIRTYRLAVPDAAIADLRGRLNRTRWPDGYVDHDWDFGTDQAYLKALCAYWANGYRALPERADPAATRVAGALLQPRALDQHAARRALCGNGAAGAAG